MRDLSIYIHIPFCARKCLYCDFLSFVVPVPEMINYVNYLTREIKEQSIYYTDHRVISVFLGGGTPSLLPAEEISRILETVKGNYLVMEGAEVTIECNPGTVTPSQFDSYITSGINRLSIGLQSAQDEELARIGRIHDYKTFLNTYEGARTAGFANINIDLMAALPGQDIASYQRSLACITDLSPEHISAYSLILEEGTPLYDNRAQYHFPTEDEDREMYRLTKRYLEEQGYRRYEISNYAREGYACRHNQVYWQRGDYAGFGLGAASMVCDVRWSMPADLEAYRECVEKMSRKKRNLDKDREGHLPYAGFPGSQVLTVKEQMEETMFLGLRMMCGVDCQAFADRFGQPIEEVYGSVIDKLMSQGLLSMEDESVRLTEKGIDVSNYAMAEFLFD